MSNYRTISLFCIEEAVLKYKMSDISAPINHAKSYNYFYTNKDKNILCLLVYQIHLYDVQLGEYIILVYIALFCIRVIYTTIM